MRFSTAAAAVAVFAASASASVPYVVGSNATYYTTSEVVAVLTTFCPHPTTVVQGSMTYTVTEPTTLTITNCPCTVVHTYSSAPKPTEVSPMHSYGAPAPAPVPTGTAPVVAHNETTVVPTYGHSAAAPSHTNEVLTGAGSRATVAGSALVGLLGAFVFLL